MRQIRRFALATFVAAAPLAGSTFIVPRNVIRGQMAVLIPKAFHLQ